MFLLVLVTLFSFLTHSLEAATAFWSVDTDGNWGDNSNWNPTTFPNGVGDEALFLDGIATAPRTVTLNQGITISDVSFSSSIPYLFAGPNPLEFQGNGGAATLNLTQGTDWLISAPTVLSSDLLLTTDPTFILTFSGDMSGAGGITKAGTGILILSGANSGYTGLITINTGILQGNTTSIPGSVLVNASGTLVFNQASPGTFASTMTGNGELMKTGAGSLTLTNNNSLLSVVVDQGSLIVNGDFAGGGTLSTSPGTILGGSGTITQDCTIGGTLAPGNSIGTIHLVGAQQFAAQSTLEIELNPIATDLLDINGSLTINPTQTTLALIPTPGNYTGVQSYLVIQTTGGITNQFSTITNTYPRLTLTPRYTANELFLDASFIGFIPFVGTGNAAPVAAALNALAPITPVGSDLDYVINQLQDLVGTAALQPALLQLQPSAFTSLAILQQTSSISIKNALWNRLEQDLNSCVYLNREKALNFWFSILGEWTSQNNYGEEPGFHAAAPGVLLGMDYLLNQNLCLGASLAYTNASLNWKVNRGVAYVDAGYLSLYGDWQDSFWRLETSLIGAYNHYHIDRYIQFNEVDRIAKSSHNGWEVSGNLKAALVYQRQATTISPFVDVNYFYLHQNSFTEKGADSLNLSVAKQNSALLESAVGIDISRCMWIRNKSVTPFLQVSVVRESRFQGSQEKATFSGSEEMVVKGAYPCRTLGQAEIGLNIGSSKNIPLVSFYYIGRYTNHFHDNSFACSFVF